MARRGFAGDERGISPVIEKLVTAGLVVLYIGGMTTVLFGGVVPAYETAAGEEVAERTLATAAGEIEAAAPRPGSETAVRATVDLPPTIDDTAYRIVLADRQLRLEHPDPEIGATTRLAVPDGVGLEPGQWESGSTLVIETETDGGRQSLTIGGQQ